MKILVVCQYYYPEPFRITDICESLVERGHDVTVLTGLPNYPEGVVLKEYRKGKKRREKLNGVNIVRCYEIGRSKSKFKLFLNYISYVISATLKVLFLKEKFDVVFVNQLSPVLMGIPAIVYKKINNKKLLLYCLDLWPDSLVAGGIKKESYIYNFFYKISKWIYNSADVILVTSSMFKDYFENVLKISNKEIIHLPQYAEDLFLQSQGNESNDTFLSEEKKYNFVFAGNIGEMQSVETIIKAANELCINKNIFFHIVGDGSKLDECRNLAKALGLKNIKFYGRRVVEEMPKFYNMADAMLVTLKNNETLSCTLPGKVQSYMAAGKPIIGAINGETRRVINEAACGYCCEAEDYKGLANIIKKFCVSNEKDLMSKNAKRFYLDKFSKEKFIKKLEKELFELEV